MYCILNVHNAPLSICMYESYTIETFVVIFKNPLTSMTKQFLREYMKFLELKCHSNQISATAYFSRFRPFSVAPYFQSAPWCTWLCNIARLVYVNLMIFFVNRNQYRSKIHGRIRIFAKKYEFRVTSMMPVECEKITSFYAIATKYLVRAPHWKCGAL